MDNYGILQSLYLARYSLFIFLVIFILTFAFLVKKLAGKVRFGWIKALGIGLVFSFLGFSALRFFGSLFVFGAFSSSQFPLSWCDPEAQYALGQYTRTGQLFYNCDVFRFKSLPGVYLVDGSYRDEVGPKLVTIIKDGSRLTPIDYNFIDALSFNAFVGSTDSLFSYASWPRIAKEYGEVSLDMVRTTIGYKLIVEINNYKSPKHVSASKRPLTYSTNRTQFILDGKIEIDLSNGEQNRSGLKVDSQNYPINQMGKNYCNFVLSRVERENCLSALGVALGDVALCQRISKYDKLKNSCVTGIAVSKKTTDLCELIPEEFDKGNCINAVAVNTNNLQTCLSIKGDIWRGLCVYDIAKVAKDHTICYQIDKTDKQIRNNCIEVVARAKGNHTLCSEIDTEEIRNDCYFNIAISIKRTDICLLISPTGKVLTSYPGGSAREWCLRVAE